MRGSSSADRVDSGRVLMLHHADGDANGEEENNEHRDRRDEKRDGGRETEASHHI